MSSMKGMDTVPSPKLMVPSTTAPKNIAANPRASSQPASIRLPVTRTVSARRL